MRKFALLLIIVVLSSSFIACSSIDKDAKKAAELNKESIELIKNKDLDKAEKKYMESQAIITSYKDSENFEKFYSAYTSYMAEEAAQK